MLHIVDHPCVRAKLSILRDRATPCVRFRECVREVTSFIAAEALRELDAEAAAGTLLVVDPPRTGLSSQAMRALLAGGPAGLVYISCNPATWVRDANRLAGGGFVLHRLQLVNMFPRTGHFELFSFWSRT